MFSKIFGRKKELEKPQEEETKKTDWSFLKADMHSHVIPGIDDGAQTVEESIILVNQLKSLGFQKIVTTPHIKSDIYPNTRDTIQKGLLELQKGLADADILMPIHAAAEYYVDELFIDYLKKKDLMTIRDNEVLIEFSFVFEPTNYKELLFDIQMKGYVPVIAHPERYVYFHHDLSIYEDLKDRGCLLQMNTISLTSYYGRSIKDVAEKLVRSKLIDYCGSDMHHLRHADGMHKALELKIFDPISHHTFHNTKL